MEHTPLTMNWLSQSEVHTNESDAQQAPQNFEETAGTEGDNHAEVSINAPAVVQMQSLPSVPVGGQVHHNMELRMQDQLRIHDIVAEHRRVLQRHLGEPADKPVGTNANPLSSSIVEV